MTTRFLNPWVDPRILDLKPPAVEAYLRTHGWQEAQSENPHWRRYFAPAGGVRGAVLVPGSLSDDSLVNLLVECVGTIASWEGRYAGDLLSELISTSVGMHSNGTAIHSAPR